MKTLTGKWIAARAEDLRLGPIDKRTMHSAVQRGLHETDLVLGARFDPFCLTDPELKRVCSLSKLAQVLSLRGVAPEIVGKVRKARYFGRQTADKLAKHLEAAIFDIRTPPRLILNESFELHEGRFRLNLRGAPVPFYPRKRHGNLYLCMRVCRSYENMKCAIASAMLNIQGEVRTVVVTEHFCKQLEDRVGIRGSHVAFVAKGLSTHRIVFDDEGQPFGQVFGYDGEVVGYCPIEEITCPLNHVGHAQGTGFHVFDEQPRWRLKTVLKDRPSRLLPSA